MATLDFLRKSPSYLERTSPKILRRRAIVLGFVNQDYRMSRGQSQKALEAVRTARFGVGLHTIHQDTAAYRNAYRWLTSTDEAELRQLERMARAKRPEMAGVACLIKDGISRWGQIVGQLQPPSQGAAAPAASETDLAEKPPSPALPAISHDSERGLVAAINEAAGKILRRLQELETENARLEEKLQVLEERERARRGWKIEDLAGEFPEVAALLQLFNSGQAQTATPTQTATPAAVTAVPPTEDLPTRCPMMGRDIHYTDKFSRHLRCITDSRLRGKIVKSLRLLAEHGPGHPGLNSKPLRRDALGVRGGEGSIIRAGDKRILYRLTNGAVEFVAIVSRANKQVYSAE